ncbi:sensor histidine kinase [Actinophytocola xanthii]|uniref:histidine kinase n=1 Tax=Actinophytocola xanthii TaxID=1912961 RepID=A0A1Q8CWD4_9PSEU|nr:histidine kinase [Actinophytocola xanthii]OLF18669.1 sensor histidine kinase [Actinophytocola xanthii]
MQDLTRRNLLRRSALGTVGLALGGVSAVVGLGYLLVAVPGLVVPPARPRIYALARRIADLNRARVRRFLGSDEEVTDYSGAQALRYIGARSVIGMFGVGVFVLFGLGVVGVSIMAWQVLTGQEIGGGGTAEEGDPSEALIFFMVGALLLFIVVWGLVGVAELEKAMVKHFLGPSEEELLRRRVSELSVSRAGVVEAVNEERRRIERDLHDGVQQRLVALGMLLGRARRAVEPAQVDTLLRHAHEEAQQSLRDLREVTWRVYPIALDKGGLPPALEAVAERSSVPVRLDCDLPSRPDLATETVAYFVVSEAVTNAIKHGAPSAIEIAVYRDGSWLSVQVRDDGRGGAAATGTGLSGLARRVAAADGHFGVESPPGGPTVVSARLPCG